ncbi:hypothetical protein GCM10018952_04630 [Streptosporangium vulgare]
MVAAKSNEIPAFTLLLSRLDLTSGVSTADALHTQHEHARQIVAAGGHYLFIVTDNQSALLRRLKALPWREAILNDRTDETGHGHREIRRMKICAVRPGLPFPHAAQAIQIKRRRTDHTTGRRGFPLAERSPRRGRHRCRTHRHLPRLAISQNRQTKRKTPSFGRRRQLRPHHRMASAIRPRRPLSRPRRGLLRIPP